MEGSKRTKRTNQDSDDCVVVKVLKPKKDRTPEVFDISSDSDNDVVMHEVYKNVPLDNTSSSSGSSGSSSSCSSSNSNSPRIEPSSDVIHISNDVEMEDVMHEDDKNSKGCKEAHLDRPNSSCSLRSVSSYSSSSSISSHNSSFYNIYNFCERVSIRVQKRLLDHFQVVMEKNRKNSA